MSTPALRKYVQAHGGEVHDTRDGLGVSFPEQEPAEQAWGGSLEEQIEKAIARAAEFGTTFVRLWRERGGSHYADSSHEMHPGFFWVVQIDETNGAPIRCECPSLVVCAHLGAAIADWRERQNYEANGANALAAWEETLRCVRAQRTGVRQEEEF